MPGNGTRQTMWMRFRATYFDRATETWHRIPGDSQSPWIKVGNAHVRARQAGRRFTIDPPLPTTSHVVRGVVKYQWRRRRTGEVVRRGEAGDARRPPDGQLRRPVRLLGRALRDQVPVASKRRGSLVITPCAPIASKRAILSASSTVHT